MYGFADQRLTIDVEIIEQVLRDRGGVLPLQVVKKGETTPAIAG